MHELSIAMALVEEVERAVFRDAVEHHEPHGDSNGPAVFYAGVVATVRVTVGKLSGVDADALRQAFPIAAEGTCCDGAALEVREVDTRATCGACGKDFVPEFAFCACTECGSTGVTITGGRELLLESIELNTPKGQAGLTDN